MQISAMILRSPYTMSGTYSRSILRASGMTSGQVLTCCITLPVVGESRESRERCPERAGSIFLSYYALARRCLGLTSV
eukprot:1171964-Rhodomonas_salina.4